MPKEVRVWLDFGHTQASAARLFCATTENQLAIYTQGVHGNGNNLKSRGGGNFTNHFSVTAITVTDSNVTAVLQF